MMNPWMTNWMNKWRPNSGFSGLGSASPQNVSLGSASSLTPWGNIWGSPRNGGGQIMMPPQGSSAGNYYGVPLLGGHPPTGTIQPNPPPPWANGSYMPHPPPSGTMLSAPPAAPAAPTGNSYLSQPQQPQAPITTPDQGGGQAIMGRGRYPFAGLTIGDRPSNNGVA